MTTFRELSEHGLFVDGDWVESKDQDPEGDVRLVQLADIGIGRFRDRSSRFMTTEKAEELRCTFLEPGDLLIARMPDPIGRACIFPGDDRRCVTVVDVCIARFDPKNISNKWLMHMVNSEAFRHQIMNFITGTTRKRISRGNLMKINFELPSISQQLEEAELLDRPNIGVRDAEGLIEGYERIYTALSQSIFDNRDMMLKDKTD